MTDSSFNYFEGRGGMCALHFKHPFSYIAVVTRGIPAVGQQERVLALSILALERKQGRDKRLILY
jgi:hypothetical protein